MVTPIPSSLPSVVLVSFPFPSIDPLLCTLALSCAFPTSIAITMRFLLPLVLFVAIMSSCSWSQQPQCRFDYTSLAVLSCQETSPQAPTRSCCDALLYAIDIWPLSPVDQGVCCLCEYMRLRPSSFDLPGAYVSCRGKDAQAVLQWLRSQATTNPAEFNCDDPCGLDVSPPPPQPRSPPTGPGGSGKRKQHQKLGVGATIAIVVGSVAGVMLLGWCLYRLFHRATKERTSPDPSNRSRPEGAGDGGLEMPRISSARRSTSALL